MSAVVSGDDARPVQLGRPVSGRPPAPRAGLRPASGAGDLEAGMTFPRHPAPLLAMDGHVPLEKLTATGWVRMDKQTA